MNEIDLFISDKSTEMKENSIDNYKTALQYHFKNFLEKQDLELEEINERNINNLYHYFKDRDLSENTARLYCGYIAHFLEDELGKYESAKKVRNFNLSAQPLTEQSGKDRRQYVTPEQYNKLLEHCERTLEKIIIALAWETGARPSEMIEIKHERDIDRDARTINMWTAKIPAKSDRKRYRQVPYSRELTPIIDEWLDYGARNKYNTSDSDYLLITERSKQMSANYPNEVLKKVAKRADMIDHYADSPENHPKNDTEKRKQVFPNMRNFRTAYITLRIRNGMDLETARQLVNHHSTEVTAGYVSESDETKRQKNEEYRPQTKSTEREFTRSLSKD